MSYLMLRNIQRRLKASVQQIKDDKPKDAIATIEDVIQEMEGELE